MVNYLLRPTLLAFLAMSLAACALPENLDHHDRDQKMDRADYKAALAPQAPESKPLPFKPITLPATPSQDQWANKPVTLKLDGNTPIRDVFTTLAEQAGMDLEMDPNISAPPLLFTANNRPLGEVLERLTAKAGLRAIINGHVLRVEPDTPLVQSYRVDYPNIERSTASNISSSLNIAAAAEGGGDTGAKNDSAASTDGKSEADFWGELSTNLTAILANQTQGDSAAPSSSAGTFSINRQAGIITVTAPSRAQKIIQNYLDKVMQAARAQVLIEARILEVTLSDAYKSGINWNSLFGGAFEFGFNAPINTPNVRLQPVPSTSPGLSLNLTNNDFQGLVNFLQTFGTVRALSSPRMTVLQNQNAVIKVVQNEVYFRLTLETTEATPTTAARRDVSSEQRTIPVGLIMNVQPSIDLATEKVTLALRPTITRISGRRTDPSILIAASDAGLTPSQIDATVPVVAVQEMDSVVSMNSGQTLVMGGLMRDNSAATTEGLPGTANIPLVQHLTNARDDATSKTELVVFIKATIINKEQDTIHGMDKDLYYQFGGDRRPLEM